ncbi:solute carrier family 2, facilitated glucose transporter member 8-like isoform X2 [Dermacentor albipictus]|uniref:solute carrier family 2, facilitated glucose transporter member 8-like isoform X2 n=1 Tax=Dermacentor albipictus TaxID=60249 RepID=UPI0038FD153A
MPGKRVKASSKTKSDASGKAAQATSTAATSVVENTAMSTTGDTAGSKATSVATSNITSKAPSTASSSVTSKVPSKGPSKQSSRVSPSTVAPKASSASEEPPAEPEAVPASNAAMEALRNLKALVKGGTPASNVDTVGARGHYVRAMVAACLCSGAAGTALGFASAAMPSIEHEPWYHLEKVPPQNRWVVDILSIGAAIGAMLSGLPLWVLGSRRTLLLCVLVAAVSWVVLAASSDTVTLLAARAACGLWLGVTNIGVSLYVAEVAPTEKRSFYVGLAEVATSIGIMASYTLSGLSWRLQATFWTLVQLPPLLGSRRYLVESPRWLLLWGRSDEAGVAAGRLYGLYIPPELRPGRLQDPDAKPSSSCRLLQGATCAQLFFLRGIQAMEGQVKDVRAALAAVIMAAMHVSFTVLFTSVTRPTGRRQLLCVSALLEVFCFAAFPPFEHLAFGQWSTAGPPSETSWSSVYSVNLLVLSYSVGLCHLPPLLTAELCSGPSWLRYLGASSVWATRWLLAFLLVHFNDQFQTLMRLRNAHIYAALVLALLALALLFLLPETEGRTLAVIDREE